MKKLLVIALMLVAANAFAAADPGPNGVGIYFDQAGETNCSLAAPYTSVNAYLLLTNADPTAGGVSGFECKVLYNTANFGAGINFTLPAGALNVLAAPYFQVGIPSALPYSPAITLMTVTFFYLGGPIQIGLGPCVPSSFGGLRAGYAAGNDPGRLLGLTPASNVPYAGEANGFVVAGVNAGTGCPVANENNSWTNVKTLYK